MYILREYVMLVRALMMLLATPLLTAFVVFPGCQSVHGPTSPTSASAVAEASISQRDAFPKDGSPAESLVQREGKSTDGRAFGAEGGSITKQRENDDIHSQNPLTQTRSDASADEVNAEPDARAEPLPQHPFHQPLGPIAGRTAKDAPAMGYANLSSEACRKQLRELEIPTKPARPVRSVATAVRIDGPLQGVLFRGPGQKSVFSTMDCRLVLALYEFAGVVARHGVVEVHYGNAYRPNAKLPTRKRGVRKPSQHAYGLAIDITGFVLRDGTTLMLPEDYHGEIGKASCGADAVMHEPSSASIKLRNLVCDVANKGVFHHMLTPNFNASHQEHFHFDIKRDGKWIVVR